MPLTLYDYPMAPNPRRARMLLAEKNIPYEKVTIDLAAGEQLSQAYRAINPSCTVPALRLEDGTIISENAGIAAYLEAAYPEPPLLGRTPVEKGLVAEWAARIEFSGLAAVADAFRNSSPAMRDRAITGPEDFEQIPALAERGLKRIALFFTMLDERLQGRDFVATGSMSVADITAFCVVDFARIVRCKPGPEHANIARWREALSQRPSANA